MVAISQIELDKLLNTTYPTQRLTNQKQYVSILDSQIIKTFIIDI